MKSPKHNPERGNGVNIAVMPEENILPEDGDARLLSNIPRNTHDKWFAELQESINWVRDEVAVFGKRHSLRRMSAWYGERPFVYGYSGLRREALPWNPVLIEIKADVEDRCNCGFNSCLLNYYNDGEDYMGWHSDNEPDLDPRSPIASLSLGAERKFSFKHRSGSPVIDVMLGSGSLLLMHPPTQGFWKHTLRKSKRIKSPRINLTFRNIL